MASDHMSWRMRLEEGASLWSSLDFALFRPVASRDAIISSVFCIISAGPLSVDAGGMRC